MIYLDHAATTPLDPQVREAMLPWLDCANPSSLHAEGRRARMAIDEARESLAGLVRCLPGEVIFTSSGTEAANLAILGTALSHLGHLTRMIVPGEVLADSGRARGGGNNPRRRILLSSVEHHCVLHTRPILESLGFSVEEIPASPGAWIKPDALREKISDDVLLVSVMHANNETGAINDVAGISRICAENGALYHCDAVQTFGLAPADCRLPAADFITISAHKSYGPKGAGALIAKAGTKPQPLTVGGGQEREMRAGTENVAAIVGFAKAAELAFADKSRADKMRAARDAFVIAVREKLPNASYTALDVCPEMTLPGHAHLRIQGVSAEVMLINLDRLGVAASSGAACSSGSVEPSHVLLATGLEAKAANEGLRFTFGRDSTVDDARRAVALLAEVAKGFP